MKLSNRTVQKMIGFAALAFLLIPAASADVWDKKTNVTFREPVEFPGGTVLAPGNYVLKLLNSPSNRNIVQVYNQDQDRMFATVMAIPAQRTEPADRTIITFYETPQDRPAFIHTWFYPGDTVGQEFPYPKGRVRYAAATSTAASPLVAAAPASPTSADSVSSRTPLTEPLAQPLASPVQASSDPQLSQVPAEEPVLLAQATPQQGIPQTPRAEAASDATAPADQLPATASNAPYWAASSLVLLAGAFLIRMARRERG